MTKRESLMVKAVLFQEGARWYAQCLEHDIGAQANTLSELYYELERVIVGQVAVCNELGIPPFGGLEPAPQEYWDMFEAAIITIQPSHAHSPLWVEADNALPPAFMCDVRVADERHGNRS